MSDVLRKVYNYYAPAVLGHASPPAGTGCGYLGRLASYS
jgi:hypothetical protein